MRGGQGREWTMENGQRVGWIGTGKLGRTPGTWRRGDLATWGKRGWPNEGRTTLAGRKTRAFSGGSFSDAEAGKDGVQGVFAKILPEDAGEGFEGGAEAGGGGEVGVFASEFEEVQAAGDLGAREF